jgi:chromosome segregation ATPase
VVVEEAISNMLTTFLVATPADGRTLQGMAAKLGLTRQSVIAMNTLKADRIYDMPPSRLPDPSLTTLLRVLSSDRPPVLNALIDQAHIESVVLCTDVNDARRIAWRKNDVQSRNVTEVYTPDGAKLWLKGNSEFTLARQRSGVARISADVTAQVQAAQKTVAELQARRGAAAARRQELETAQRRADEAVKAVQKRLQMAINNGRNAKAELTDAEQAAANLTTGAGEAAAPDADAFDAELQAVAEEEAVLKKSLVGMEEELGDAVKAAAAAKEAADEVGRNAAEFVEQSKRLAKEMNSAIEQVEEADRQLKHMLGIRAQMADVLAKLEKDLSDARTNAASEAAKAELAARCTREEAEATPLPKLKEGEVLTVARLTSLLSSAEARMAKEAARNKRPYDEVAGDLMEASREVKRVKRALSHAMQPAKRMREGLSKRTSLLRRTARMLAQLCSTRFNHHMSQRGHAGRLVVSYQEGEMSLEVQLANTAPGNNGGSVTVTDTKQLSGGERSYTTLSFTLSLNESSDSPFCAMDEWDVFMDAVARKVSLDKMMRYAEEHKEKQFILITPQDISAVAPTEYITIQKLKPARQ